jgi:TFIIF-interacting CTD phosphatase-like protein
MQQGNIDIYSYLFVKRMRNNLILFYNLLENGIAIEGWINDPHDEALLDLLPFLDALRFTEDVRSILSLATY